MFFKFVAKCPQYIEKTGERKGVVYKQKKYMPGVL